MLQSFRPVFDVLDIIIISVLLYQGYKLLIGTRAWNVFRGLAAVTLLWVLATQFQLGATKWIFDRVAPVAFIALIVVFQPELRAALERVGRGRFGKPIGEEPVQEIMTAVRELATQQTGALIAIERGTPLREYGLSGTTLDAPVTSALLQTIFDSKGPLHDGGIIIQGKQILAAGAIFPLSEYHEAWTITHGTRHRAALGLSETTDALVIVISEEQGTVGLAQEGQLRPEIPPSELLTALRKVYQE